MMKGGLSYHWHLIIVTQKSNSSSTKGHRYEPSFKDILQVFEAMLCFDEWLRKDTYWADHNADVNKAIAKSSIAKLMHLSKK
jgi:hypothetical protein